MIGGATTGTGTTTEQAGHGGRDRALFVLLLVDAVLLAVIELMFLPLRLDGTVLPKAGDAPVPVTVLLAMVTTPMLVLAAARLVRSKQAGVPLAVWLLTLLIVGLFGPGSDRVLLQDWRALLLLAGGALPAALVLGGVLGKASARESAAGKGTTGSGTAGGRKSAATNTTSSRRK